MEVNSSISGAGPAKQADNAVQGSLPQWCRRPEYGACPRGVATACEVAASALGQASIISTRSRRAQESEPAAAAVDQPV